MNAPRPFVRRRVGLLAAGALLAPVLAPATALAQSDAPYAEGQRLEIRGAVTDAAGVPLRGKTVLLSAYRKGFELRDLAPGRRDSRKGLVHRTTLTDSQGRYTLEWAWFDYYNRFELSVGEFGEDGFEPTERVDISRRILQGSPLTVSFMLRDAGRPSAGSAGTAAAPEPRPAEPARSYEPSGPSGSSEETRVRDREGEPDLIDTLELPYGREVTWWYFGRGRAYRFLDGELRHEISFDPVPERGS